MIEAFSSPTACCFHTSAVTLALCWHYIWRFLFIFCSSSLSFSFFGVSSMWFFVRVVSREIYCLYSLLAGLSAILIMGVWGYFLSFPHYSVLGSLGIFLEYLDLLYLIFALFDNSVLFVEFHLIFLDFSLAFSFSFWILFSQTTSSSYSPLVFYYCLAFSAFYFSSFNFLCCCLC